MNWQQMVSLAIVGLAFVLLLRSRLRRRKFNFEHDTACGCSLVPATVRADSLVFQARKGERPRVLVRMK